MNHIFPKFARVLAFASVAHADPGLGPSPHVRCQMNHVFPKFARVLASQRAHADAPGPDPRRIDGWNGPGDDRDCQRRVETRRSADGRSHTSGAIAFWSPRSVRWATAGTRTEISCWRGVSPAFRSGSPCHDAECRRDRDRHPLKSARCLARLHRRADRDHDAAVAASWPRGRRPGRCSIGASKPAFCARAASRRKCHRAWASCRRSGKGDRCPEEQAHARAADQGRRHRGEAQRSPGRAGIAFRSAASRAWSGA